MVYHENGGNESFEVGYGIFPTLKGCSDPDMRHNFLVFQSQPASQALRS